MPVSSCTTHSGNLRLDGILGYAAFQTSFFVFDLLVREQELEVFKLFAGIRDLICTSVHPFSVLMLTTCLVVRKHTVAVFHCKDLVVNSTVVAVLVSEIVKLLT